MTKADDVARIAASIEKAMDDTRHVPATDYPDDPTHTVEGHWDEWAELIAERLYDAGFRVGPALDVERLARAIENAGIRWSVGRQYEVVERIAAEYAVLGESDGESEAARDA